MSYGNAQANKNSHASVVKRILALDKNLLTLALGIVVFAVSVIAPLLIFSTVIYAGDFSIDENGMLLAPDALIYFSDGLYLLSLIFLSLPLLTGLFWLGRQTVSGNRPMLKDIFVPFGNAKRYFRSMVLGFLILIRLAVPIMVAVGGIAVAVLLFGDLSEYSIFVAVSAFVFLLCATVVVLIGACYMTSFLGFVENFVFCGSRIPHALRHSARLSACHRAEVIKNSLFAMLHALPSVASLGIYLLVYGGERMLVSHFVSCDQMIDKI